MTAQKDNSVTSDPASPPPLGLSPEAAALKPKQAEKPGANPALTFPPEKGGPKGLEPTRYGDWEKKGRCSDF
ncbi:MAG: DUF1674 domain-containing protein [Proteobacteria bacterium]|nr:DUF1674 domain-containing protein [Pseudomonadota bacterium]